MTPGISSRRTERADRVVGLGYGEALGHRAGGSPHELPCSEIDRLAIALHPRRAGGGVADLVAIVGIGHRIIEAESRVIEADVDARRASLHAREDPAMHLPSVAMLGQCRVHRRLNLVWID